jgi:hypothetical protein
MDYPSFLAKSFLDAPVKEKITLVPGPVAELLKLIYWKGLLIQTIKLE